jgi:hypothetical protein
MPIITNNQLKDFIEILNLNSKAPARLPPKDEVFGGQAKNIPVS